MSQSQSRFSLQPKRSLLLGSLTESAQLKQCFYLDSNGFAVLRCSSCGIHNLWITKALRSQVARRNVRRVLRSLRFADRVRWQFGEQFGKQSREQFRKHFRVCYLLRYGCRLSLSLCKLPTSICGIMRGCQLERVAHKSLLNKCEISLKIRKKLTKSKNGIRNCWDSKSQTFNLFLPAARKAFQ